MGHGIRNGEQRVELPTSHGLKKIVTSCQNLEKMGPKFHGKVKEGAPIGRQIREHAVKLGRKTKEDFG